MERYFTNTQNVELTDRMIEGIMITLTHHVPRVLAQPDNYDSWAEIMWSGTVAHNNLMNTGRVGDWGSHDIEHELSAIYDVAHGAGLAVVFPAWMKYVYKHDVARFCQFAVRVWGVDPNFRSPEETALEGISRMEKYFRSIGMPVTLKELGVPEDRFDEMASKATGNDTYTIGQFVKLKRADVLNIIKLAR
jgi:alcohol dehydrogenase YqhD (iron-dependent ADH family)